MVVQVVLVVVVSVVGTAFIALRAVPLSNDSVLSGKAVACHGLNVREVRTLLPVFQEAKLIPRLCVVCSNHSRESSTEGTVS